MTIFWNPAGPVVKYEDGMLGVWNLNPEVKTGWRMSRWEMHAYPVNTHKR